MKTNHLKILALSLLFHLNIHGQGFDQFNYPFEILSNTTLENMNSGTVILGAGNSGNTGLMSFGAGFEFEFAGITYSDIDVSSSGWIKLGSVGILESSANLGSGFNTPRIAPYWGDVWPWQPGQEVKYDILGSAPNRKAVIDWVVSGPQFSGTPIHFQLWLHEENGIIEFVYDTIPPNSYGFAIGFEAILNLSNDVVSVLAANPSTNSTASYSSIYNGQSIPINSQTRFRFDPSIASPSGLNFVNVNAGCLDVEWQDNSNNELAFEVYRSDDNVNFSLIETIISTSQSSIGSVYTFTDNYQVQSNSTYYYRIIAVNGVSPNSASLDGSISTLPAQLSGVYTVPGDYPDIQSAISDLECNRMADTVFLELQNTYDPSNEVYPLILALTDTVDTLPLVIRPAANVSSIVFEDSIADCLVSFNYCNRIIIDGRPGGIGSSNAISIINNNAEGNSVCFSNSNYNKLRYCNIAGSSNEIRNGVVQFGGYHLGSNTHNQIDYCDIQDVPSGKPRYLVNFDDSDSRMNLYNSVTNCNLHNVGAYSWLSGSSAMIYYGEGGSDLSVTCNSFYYNDSIPAGFTASAVPSFIRVNASESNMLRISKNYFGGTSPYCMGSPLYSENSGGLNYLTLVDFSGYSPLPTSRAYVDSNYFGNYNVNFLHNAVSASAGYLSFQNNVIGSDTAKIVLGYNSNLGISIGAQDTLIFHNNIMRNISCSGSLDLIHAHTNGGNSYNSIQNNVIGGYDNSGNYSIISVGQLQGMEIGAGPSNPQPQDSSKLIVRNNHLYGWSDSSSTNSSTLIAIDVNPSRNAICDSNIIHHMYSNYGFAGISQNGIGHVIHHNYIHSCAVNAGNCYGIGVDGSNCLVNANRIYSIGNIGIGGNYGNYSTGLWIDGHNNIISNNLINLGRDSLNNLLESTGVYGVSLYAGDSNTIEHNNIYLGGQIGIDLDNAYGIYIFANNPEVFIRNNCIHNAMMNDSTTSALVRLISFGNFANQLTISNNAYYSDEMGMGGIGYPASIGDMNGVYGTIGYNNPSDSPGLIDMEITGTSVIYDAGMPSTLVHEDYYGNIRDINFPDIGAFEIPFFSLGPDDALVAIIEEPGDTICTDSVDIYVTLANYGSATLNAVDIEVFNNSNLVLTNNWTGTIASVDSLTNVFVGTIYVPHDIVNNIEVRTNNPNGNPDINTNNDAEFMSIPIRQRIDLGPDTVSCNNLVYNVIDNSGIFTSHYWNNSFYGSNVFTALPPNDTLVILQVSDSLGCISIDSLEIKFPVVNPIPINDTTICDSAIISINAYDPSYVSYWWSTGYSSPSINIPFNQGTYPYTVTVHDQYGCSLQKTVYITHPTPINIGLQPYILVCDSSNVILDVSDTFISSYLWSTGETTGAIAVSFNPGYTNYSVEVTDYYGCTYSDSVDVNYADCTNISFIEQEVARIYPNPSTGLIYIEVQQFNNSNFSIYSSNGQKIKHGMLEGTLNKIDISDLSDGLYHIHIENDQSVIQMKFVKH